MWSSIETLKQNLNKIALDVHDDVDDDDDKELEIYASTNGGDFFDRRNSHGSAHSNSASRSPMANGIDFSLDAEIEQYKAEIKRLQESESEVKALSVNYAALLKEKEDQISRLNQENSSLKQNLDATKEALNVSRSEDSKTSSANNIYMIKGSGDQSPNRQHKSATQAKNRSVGNQIQNGILSKQDAAGNGITYFDQADAIYSKMEMKNSNVHMKEKELADLLEEKNKLVASMQDTHELQMKQLRLELEKERDEVANLRLKLQEEHKSNKSFQEQLRMLKMGESKSSMEMIKLRSELNDKTSDIRRLQMELSRKEDEDEDADDTVKGLKRVIATLERDNAKLKMAKNELEAALETCRNAPLEKTSMDGKANPSGSFPGRGEMELSLQQLERELKESRSERDKALQELSRLKQHLLEKESEESEKMDEDSKVIEELRENNEYQKAQILHLEKVLKQTIANQEEVRMINNNEIQKSKEMIEDLNKKLANCMSTIDSKNVELLNLQTILLK